MTHIRVDPRKVQTVEMRDGTKYRVGRTGSVLIDNPKHEAELLRHGAPDEGETGWLSPRLGYMAAESKPCACGFSAWPWQTVCPRCGSAL